MSSIWLDGCIFALGMHMTGRVTHGALVPYRYSYASHLCRSSQYRMTFIPLLVSLLNDLGDPIFDGGGLAGLKSRANAIYWPSCLLHFFTVFPFSSFILWVGIVELRSSD